MERLGSGPTPTVTAFRRAGRSGAGEHLLLQRNASAVGLHHTKFARLRLSVYMWRQKVRRLDVSFLPRRLWPAGRG